MNFNACLRSALCGLSITSAAPMACAADAPPAEAPSPLEPVTIRGSRLTEVAGQRSIPAQELRSVPGSLGDPLKSLQSLPGVASVSDASSDPAIRGSRPEDNRFLIDGLPAGRVFHVGGLTSVLHPDLVSRFDLYAAAFGPEFANATGGIIDVNCAARAATAWAAHWTWVPWAPTCSSKDRWRQASRSTSPANAAGSTCS